jgi:hypothetical protein
MDIELESWFGRRNIDNGIFIITRHFWAAGYLLLL